MPIPAEMPMPSEPVDMSRPGRRVMSGWPWSRELAASKVASSATGK